MTAGRPVRPTQLKSPDPCAVEYAAADTALTGTRNLKISESMAAMPRLLVHRIRLGVRRGLRDDRPSHAAMAARTAKKAASLTGIS